MKVVVTEREPIIDWVQDGSETWIDAEGVAFPPRGEPTTHLVKVEAHGTPPSPAQSAVTGDVQAFPEGEVVVMMNITPTLSLSADLVSAILVK
jgi:cell division septal protein FtsQ